MDSDVSTSSIQPSSGPSIFYSIFTGPQGLRSGWRVLIFYALFILFTIGLTVIRRVLTPGGFHGNSFTPGIVTLQELVFFAALAITLAVTSRIERRAFRFDGLPRPAVFGRLFWSGAAWGIAAISVLLLAMRGADVFDFGNLALKGWSVVGAGAGWAVAFVLVGIVEESVSRGYAQTALARGIGFWPAAIVNSALFAAIHLDNRGETVLGIFSVLVVALFFCFTLWRTGSLWFAVGFHFMWDYAQTFLYGVPDSAEVTAKRLLAPHIAGPAWLSGGTAGPEGSALCIAVYGAAAVLFAVAYPRKKWN